MVEVSLLACGINEPRASAQAIDVEQDRAVAAIERLGGKVERDRTSPGDSVVRVDLRMTGATDTDLAVFKHLKGLRSLYLSSNSITDAGLTHLEGLTGLRRLDIDFNPISDAGLAHLEGLINLRRLDIHVTKVTTAGVERLQRKLPRVVIDRSVDTRVLLGADDLVPRRDDRADRRSPAYPRRVPRGSVGGRPK
jgi:hypothetical protein